MVRRAFKTLPSMPSFNEAEARAPRMDCLVLKDLVTGAVEASMRPRRVRLGWGEQQPQERRAAAASMRPRRVRLGWVARQAVRPRREMASMRPRRVRLGWASRANPFSRGIYTLQ